jgi:hypothetical protein
MPSPRRVAYGNLLVVVPFILFALAGLGFGLAAPGWTKVLPLVFPLILGIFAMVTYGVDGWIVLRLVIALLLTAVGIVVGRVLEARYTRDATAT